MKKASALLLLILFLSASAVVAQDTSGYKMPPKALADLVDAPLTPYVNISPDENWMLLVQPQSLPTIKELSQPELRIAGLRINPKTNGSSRTRHHVDISLKSMADGKEHKISGYPEGALLGYPSWSWDSKHLVNTVTTEEGIEIWLISVEKKTASKLTDQYLNAALRGGISWLPESKSILCKLIPADRGSAPKAPEVALGPIIQENIGKVAPARTYQDLLKNAYDEDLFDYYATSRLAEISLDGNVKYLTAPGATLYGDASPDGKYILAATMHRPYSYIVPYYRFPYRVDILDREGKLIKTIADLPLEEEVVIHFDAVVDSPRGFGWRQDSPATIYWAKAQDGGNPFKEAKLRDKVFYLDAPFTGEKKELIALEYRFGGVYWGDGSLALVNEVWRKNRKLRTWIVAPDEKMEKDLLWDRSMEDRYGDPGRPLMHLNKMGSYVLRKSSDGKHLFLTGSGATPKGNRPFISTLDLETKKTAELWRNNDESYEMVVDLLRGDESKIITRRETVTTPPNYYVRDLKSGTTKQVTDFPHPTPQLKGVTKELIKYKRADGVDLSGTLYLPAGYKKEDGPLPMLMWAYPREFKSAAAAGQISGSPYSFVRVYSSSPLLFLAHGYAVLSGPTMPIIGEGDKEPNDTFREQLVASAKAAVDKVVEMGVADPKRIAIGGHSYGAFMTANLLAHSDLFATGIARSGAYNRTLTPFGFQSEERTYWQAPEIYNAMAPFMHADKVNEPILLIHGEADNNSGTFPIQSKRYYAALKGHGTTTRLVMLPHESHGYRARESLMHMVWEMATWLDTYVKNRK
jgi:dipeptidyl aminopeptidase/acylaminoacyl peptidase